MTQWSLMFTALFLGALTGAASVFQYQPNGDPLHWDLATPESNIDIVSTNTLNPLLPGRRCLLDGQRGRRVECTPRQLWTVAVHPGNHLEV